MADKLFDYKCTDCDFVDEVWTEDPSVKMQCPQCQSENTFERTFISFSILQTNPNDSSNSWVSPRGKQRKTYGDNRAINGY